MNAPSVLLLLLTLLAGPLLAPVAAQPVKVGFSAPLTSPIAFIAEKARFGTEYAVAELNGKGGVMGRKVEALYGDTRLDPNEAINIARRYTLQDKVVAYFGDFTSSGTLAIIDILGRASVPQITYTNAIKITRSGYKHVINLKPNSDHLTAAALDYAVKGKGYKKLAVMALDDEYGKGNVDAIQRYLKKFGGAEIAGMEWYRIDAKEFRPLLTKLAGLKPDALVMTGSLADTALIMKQYGELGLKIPVVGGGGHSTRAFRSIAGSASDGMIVVPAFWPGHFTNKEAVEFARGFTAKHGSLEGDEWSMFAYDAVMLVAQAMERARSTDGPKVIAELFKTGPVSGAAGTYTITPTGEIETTVFIAAWSPSGKVELIKAWDPPKLD